MCHCFMDGSHKVNHIVNLVHICKLVGDCTDGNCDRCIPSISMCDTCNSGYVEDNGACTGRNNIATLTLLLPI